MLASFWNKIHSPMARTEFLVGDQGADHGQTLGASSADDEDFAGGMGRHRGLHRLTGSAVASRPTARA
jgi:hypothetical protein